MKIIKSKNVQETLLNIVLIIGGLFLIAALVHYGSNKDSQKDMMVSGGGNARPMRVSGEAKAPPSKPMQRNPQQMGQIEASSSDVFDTSFAPVNGGAVASGAPHQNKVMNPKELLPKQQNANSALVNPPSNDLSRKNFLNSGNHIGINTVGGVLRNANLQVRSEPPNPQQNVGPWSNTTIEPDLMRRPLEIGGN